MIKNSMVIY